MRLGRISALGTAGCLLLAGCGPGGPSGAAASTGATLPCIVRPGGLLTGAQMPASMTPTGLAFISTQIGGLHGPLDISAAYVGGVELTFDWTGLPAADASNLPRSGPLFTDHPSQILDVTEAVGDYGTAADATEVMTAARSQANNNSRTAIEAMGATVGDNPPGPRLGDDTFIAQEDMGAGTSEAARAVAWSGPFVGDVVTTIHVRDNDIVYSISIDASPGADGAATVELLVHRLIASKQAACAPPTTPSATTAGLPCQLGDAVLLAASALPASMEAAGPPVTDTALGLNDNGDSAYPGYVADTSEYFSWTGLTSGSAETIVQQGYASAVPSSAGATPPSMFVPPVSPLYSDYPAQVFLVSEEVSDFGRVSSAEAWLTGQRAIEAPGASGGPGAGVLKLPSVAPLGDDSFVYQTTASATSPSDTFTDIEVREGAAIYAVSIDSGANANAVALARALVAQLVERAAARCGDAAPAAGHATPTAAPLASEPVVATPTAAATNSNIAASTAPASTTGAAPASAPR